MTVPLAGSITALATPFDAAGELDLDAWQRMIAQQLEAGTQGLVVAGSTGEAAALYDREYDTVVRLAVEAVSGRIPVLAGTGLSNTAKTIEQTRRAGKLGADAALVVTPPYVRPTQEGLLAHFSALADDGALPVVLYNVPGRSGCDLLPDTVARLAGHPRIIGIKEANTDSARIAALLPLRSPTFSVLSGDDPTCRRDLLAGLDGVVSVASNVIPRAMRRLYDLARGGDRAQAEALDARLQEVFAFLGVEPNPVPLKALLSRLGLGHGLRLPLLPLSAAHADAADRIAARLQAVEQASGERLAA
ncbi:MAG TPA: 4-hydroxy-tetrahydrodipicolinate synthase [Xanthomonadaceae bacterium]|nr:4-hydroxy-tetrahydrodipicolinate synthase [Xanthomonadaceae bacterium]